MAQTKRDRAGPDIPQTVTARTRGQPEAEHSVRSTGGSTGAGSPRRRQDHLSFCAVASARPATFAAKDPSKGGGQGGQCLPPNSIRAQPSARSPFEGALASDNGRSPLPH